MSDAYSRILAQIFAPSLSEFDPSLPWAESDANISKFCPNYDNVVDLAKLLSSEPREEDLQKFLEDNPQFLMGFCGFGYDRPLAFLSKPSVGTQYKADFAILTYGQGGCSISLIEIKRSAEKLYTRSGDFSKKLREAINQTIERKIWLETNSNSQTFINDLINRSKELPEYPKRSPNSSFKLFSSTKIEREWRTFGGYQFPRINHIIIIGRWAKLLDFEREKLIFNNVKNEQLCRILTYDQVARYGFDRPSFLPY